jgi:hypothetical protein
MPQASFSLLESNSFSPEVVREVEARAERITPIITFPGKGKYYVEAGNIFVRIYMLGPVASRKARRIKPLATIATRHPRRGRLGFGPTVAEVLCQIPDEHLSATVAFEIIGRVEKRGRNGDDVAESYFVATVQLYARE